MLYKVSSLELDIESMRASSRLLRNLVVQKVSELDGNIFVKPSDEAKESRLNIFLSYHRLFLRAAEVYKRVDEVRYSLT